MTSQEQPDGVTCCRHCHSWVPDGLLSHSCHHQSPVHWALLAWFSEAGENETGLLGFSNRRRVLSPFQTHTGELLKCRKEAQLLGSFNKVKCNQSFPQKYKAHFVCMPVYLSGHNKHSNGPVPLSPVPWSSTQNLPDTEEWRPHCLFLKGI